MLGLSFFLAGTAGSILSHLH